MIVMWLTLMQINESSCGHYVGVGGFQRKTTNHKSYANQ